MAMKYLNEKDYDAAMMEINSAHASNKNPGFEKTIIFQRARIHAGQKNFAAAIEDFNKSERMDFTGPDLYIERGKTYWNNRQLSEALDDFIKAIPGKKGIAYFYAGNVLLEMKKYAEAQEAFGKARELGYQNPKLGEALAIAGSKIKKQKQVRAIAQERS